MKGVSRSAWRSAEAILSSEVLHAAELTSETDVAASMRAWLDGHPADRLGTHRYIPEQFALDPEEIRETFKHYVQRFDVR